jgi:hypothetical protein
MRRVLDDDVDKARLSRSRTHLRLGSFGAINAASRPPRQLSLSPGNNSDCSPLPTLATGPRSKFTQQAGCSRMRGSSRIIAGRVECVLESSCFKAGPSSRSRLRISGCCS